MTPDQLTTLANGGLSVVALAGIILFFWRGVPYLASRDEKKDANFETRLDAKDTAHRDQIDRMVTAFTGTVERNTAAINRLADKTDSNTAAIDRLTDRTEHNTDAIDALKVEMAEIKTVLDSVPHK